MKPLILAFKETSSNVELDYSSLIYDYDLNLNVLKETRLPAIEHVAMETETFTKTQGESTDSDRDAISLITETTTGTHAQLEDSDDDKDVFSILINESN